jgi:aryl-alcohol dehydrogenase-like predicted oxidoreductase
MARLALSVDPAAGDPEAVDAAVVRSLRRARSAGITTFDLAETRDVARVEGLIGRAFPEPDPALWVVLPRSVEGLVRDSAAHLDRNGSASDLAEALTRSFETSDARLGPERSLLIEWQGRDPRPIASTPSPIESAQRRGATTWVWRPEPGWWDVGAGARPGALPAMLSGSFSLLDRRVGAFWSDPSVALPEAFVARDPFAGGRLDGSRLHPGLGERGPGTGPTRLRDLEEELAPVLRLGFLTAGGRRTLPQAALQYLFHWPWVQTVVLPWRYADRVDALQALARIPPLDDEELRRVRALPSPPPASPRTVGSSVL